MRFHGLLLFKETLSEPIINMQLQIFFLKQGLSFYDYWAFTPGLQKSQNIKKV